MVRLAELGCSKLSLCPLCVRSRCCSQKQCWHFLVARFCQVFVSQLMYLCLLPSSLRCWGDFFLSRLETFSRLWICTGYFRPPRPDVFLLQSVFSVHRAPSPQPGGVEQPGCPPERSTGWGLPWTGPVGPDGWIWRYREVNFLIGVLWFGSTDPGVSCCFCLQEGRGSHCQMCLACAELWSGHERRQPGVTCSCQEMGIAY